MAYSCPKHRLRSKSLRLCAVTSTSATFDGSSYFAVKGIRIAHTSKGFSSFFAYPPVIKHGTWTSQIMDDCTIKPSCIGDSQPTMFEKMSMSQPKPLGASNISSKRATNLFSSGVHMGSPVWPGFFQGFLGGSFGHFTSTENFGQQGSWRELDLCWREIPSAHHFLRVKFGRWFQRCQTSHFNHLWDKPKSREHH